MVLGRALREFDRYMKRKVIAAADDAVRKAALAVVNDLQVLGPYWDGYFHDAWEVREGDVEIPADQEGKKLTRQPKADANSADFKISDIPERRGGLRYDSKPLVLTIGNRMNYRDIAMDLVPDAKGEYRYERAGATAEQDWYVKYYAGGPMDQRVGEAIKDLRLPD